MKKRIIPGYTLRPRNGYYQVHRIGLSAERVKKEPAFLKTRIRAGLFARMATLSRQLTQWLKQNTGVSVRRAPLNGLLVQAHHPKAGEQPIGWPLLKGVDLNPCVPWAETVQLTSQAVYHLPEQQWHLYWPAHNPVTHFRWPAGITHYRLRAAVLSINRQGALSASSWKQTTLFPVKNITVPQQHIVIPVSDEQGEIQFLVAQILVYIPAGKREKLIVVKQAAPLAILEVRSG